MIGCYSEVYQYFSGTVEHGSDQSRPLSHTKSTVKNLDTMAAARMNTSVNAINNANDNDNTNENGSYLHWGGWGKSVGVRISITPNQ